MNPTKITQPKPSKFSIKQIYNLKNLIMRKISQNEHKLNLIKKYIRNRYKIKVFVNNILRQVVISSLAQIRIRELMVKDNGDIRNQMSKILGLTENFFKEKNFKPKIISIQKRD